MYRNIWSNLQLMGMLIALALTCLGGGCRGQEPGEPTPASQPAPLDDQDLVTIIFACQEYARSHYEDLAEQFHEENPRIKVRVISQEEILGLGEDRRWPEDATRRLVSAADTLDGWGVIPRATRQGLVRDLTPFIEADQSFHREDFYPGALESLQWDGGTWGLPFAISFEMIFYDKEAFDEADVAYPEPEWRWDDLLTKAQALTQREGDRVTRWGFVQPWFDPLPFITGRTGPLVDDSITPPTPLLDEPEVIEAVRWYADLYLKHQVAPFFEPPAVEPHETVLPEGYSLVAEGGAAMWTESSHNFPRHSQSKEIGMVSYPVGRPTDATTPISARSYAMSAGTAHPQESWRWLDFLTRHIDAGPYGFSSLPARRSVAAETGIWEDLDEDVAAAYRFALEHAYPRYFAYTGAWRALYEAIVTILKGEKNVEETLAEAQVMAQQLLSEEARERAQITPQPVVVATQEPVGEEGVEILFISPFNMTSYEELAERFHEDHPDITVKVRRPTFSGCVGLEEMAAAGDCFAWFGMAADENSTQHILNLQPFLDADPAFSHADFYPQAVKPFRRQGDLWGLPGEAFVKVLAYNQHLFDAAGVAYPQAGWDLDDFLSKALALTQGEGEDKQYGFISLHGGSDDLDFVALQGVSLMDEERDPPWPRLDDPAVVEAVRWYVELSTVHGVNPLFSGEDPSRPETMAWDRRWRLVNENRAAMWIISPSDEEMLSDAPERQGVAPLPLNDGGAIPLNFLGYYISAPTSYPHQCWTWLKFLSDHGQQITQGLPARRSAAESPEYTEQVGEEMVAAMRFSLQYGAFGSPMDQETWLVPTYYWLQQAFGQALQGQDVAQALAEAQRKAEAHVLCLEREDDFTNAEILRTCAREVDPDYPPFGE